MDGYINTGIQIDLPVKQRIGKGSQFIQRLLRCAVQGIQGGEQLFIEKLCVPLLQFGNARFGTHPLFMPLFEGCLRTLGIIAQFNCFAHIAHIFFLIGQQAVPSFHSDCLQSAQHLH